MEANQTNTAQKETVSVLNRPPNQAPASNFNVPPSATFSLITAPPVPLVLQQTLHSANGTLTPFEQSQLIAKQVPAFDWRNNQDIKKYCIDMKLYFASAMSDKKWTVIEECQGTYQARDCVTQCTDPPDCKTQIKDKPCPKSYIAPPVNQDQCGNCWACATASAISDRFCIWNDLDNSTGYHSFSIPYLTAMSSPPNKGCQGGDMTTAGKFVQQQGIFLACNCPSTPGVCVDQSPASCCSTQTWNQITQLNGQDSKSYPLVHPISQDIPLGQQQIPAVVNLVDYYDSNGTLQRAPQVPTLAQRKAIQSYMKSAIVSHGPIVTTIFIDEADSQIKDFWGGYTGGIIQFRQRFNQPANHAVKIIGWGVENVTGQGEIEYWTVMNSWGPNWGENGCFRFAMSTDTINPDMQIDYPFYLNGAPYGGGTAFVISGQVWSHDLFPAVGRELAARKIVSEKSRQIEEGLVSEVWRPADASQVSQGFAILIVIVIALLLAAVANRYCPIRI